MKISNLHTQDKEVSAISLFKGELGTSTAIQILKDGKLKEHITKTPALLLCIVGKVNYEDETGQLIELSSGDYVDITPNVKHWLTASELSQLVLLK
jgi:quercetin dioxygenase-like cupin family protein